MANTNQIRILAVVGSTASGKTGLAVELAKRLNGEVVSCDSMQIYRRMDIGTAKPTEEEMSGIAHHLLDCVDPEQAFSCADYVEMARASICEIASRGKLPVLCGGTGLYLDALLRGSDFEDGMTDPAVRASLLDFAAEHGAHALHERLRAVDPESADAIHENNVKRVARALEIFQTTGRTKSELDRLSREVQSPYRATVIGLRYADRDCLYGRIDRRVDQMLEHGLLQETRTLLEEGVFEVNQTAAQAIGYKELLPFLRGECSLCEATERLKTATRRYAKRQSTWFRAREYVQWIDVTSDGAVRPIESILQQALELFGADTIG